MKVVQSGRNPTMRHLHRVHGVSIRVLHDMAGEGRHSCDVAVVYTPIDDMNADIFTHVFTKSSNVAHALNTISIIKQETVSDKPNRSRLTTKTPVALPCIPVLMPKPPGHGADAGHAAKHAGNAGDVAERFPQQQPPPPPVLSLSRPRTNSRVRLDAFFITSPPVGPRHTSIPPAPPGRTQRTQPVLASELYDPWVAGPNPMMQESRPILPQHVPDPWAVRPLAVPPNTVDRAELSHTASAVRRESMISVPTMAVPKDT